MRWIVGWSLRFRYIVLALAAGMMVFGAGQLRDMAVDVFPEFAPPRVEVQTACIGLTAGEVESLITVPLEETLNGIEGLDVLRSKSVPQLSSVLMIFKPGTDLIKARQLVQERLATITPTIPSWATPPVILQPLSSTSRVMKVGISSEQHSVLRLSMISYWTIRNRLLKVPGVANVAIWGQRKQMTLVQVDPDKMAAKDVTLEQVMAASGDALDAGLLKHTNGTMVGTGGWVETAEERLPIRHVLPITTGQDITKIPITNDEGDVVPLSDVADVVEGHQPLIGDAVINDGEGLMLIVEKLPWGNTLEVTRGVEAAIAQLQPGLPGVDIDTTIFRPATFVEVALDNLNLSLLLGFLLVVLIIGAFLFEWRAAVISLITIPISLMAAVLVLQWRGDTINTMILAGLVIALGVVVDDAIIDVENIMRRLRQHRAADTGRSTARVILDASMEVRSPIIYATLIIIAAAVPILYLDGLAGAFFNPLTISYALAVGASLLVALTVTPAMSLMLLGKAAVERRQSPLVVWLQNGYQRALATTMRRPRWAYSAVAVVMAAGLAVLPFLGQSLLPSFKERDFLMHWLAQPGTSHPEMVRISTAASKELRAIPGVRNFGAHIGQAVNADEVVGMYFGENWVSVDPSADYDKTVAAIQEVVDGYPGLQRDVQTYLKERIKEVLTGASETIVVRIYGDDLTGLRETAAKIQERIAKIDGIVEAKASLQKDIPQIEVQVDLQAAREHGLKPGDVRRATGALVATEEVSDTYWEGRVYDVRVWSVPASRSNPEAIKNLPIDKPDGTTVRLADVASVQIKPTPNVIEREGGSRRIDVGANVRDRDLGAVARDVEAALAEVSFPRGFHAEVLGEYAERQAAQNRLLGYAGIALLVVLILLNLSFRSWRLAILSLATLPVALIGGVLAAYLGDGIISLGALVGFFTVMGIAARNGILMINHFQHLEEHENEPFGVPLVLRGARERLSPILMTALAAGLAVLPLVIMGDLPGHEIEHPLAVVVLGGLVTSTLLNLFVTPPLYLRFAKRRRQATTT
ncbi:efflux RND transporter permease subunit [Nonomuraea endophytica]|uniref:CzcA family heavy metal efflux pump n=1 Tax=Nonomuraea endophytica TaxID=714136 RepID=A0A7W8ABX4_9ACTN|nr:efflux RND transporter permease subunit [Nonomuraea endophytica]MBB5081933.1 CzcA family heavy metal efflux pump [Nonomuraea endophytica]